MKRGYVVGPLAVIAIIIITTFLSSQANAWYENGKYWTVMTKNGSSWDDVTSLYFSSFGQEHSDQNCWWSMQAQADEGWPGYYKCQSRKPSGRSPLR